MIRERSGIASAELARRAGIDKTALCRIEQGKRRGTAANARSLADVLHVPLEAIAVFEVETPVTEDVA